MLIAMTADDSRRLFAEALRDHQAGRLQAAEAGYRQILASQPRHADSLHLLGVVAHQAGRHEPAVELIGQAIAIAGAAAPPSYALNLGAALQAAGRIDEAAAAFERVVKRQPDHALAHNNLGNALSALGRTEEAIAALRRAAQLKLDYAEAHYNLGNVLREVRQFEEAAAAYRRALQLRPDLDDALNNLGIALEEMGQPEESAAAYRRAISLRPDHAAAWCNLANILVRLRQFDEATQAYRQALRLKPDFVDATYNLGAMLDDRGQRAEAVSCYVRTLALQPHHDHARLRLTHALQHLCDWPALAPLERDVLDGVQQARAAITPFPLVALSATAADQLASATAYAATFVSRPSERPLRTAARTSGPIRIGYLSADFHAHATAYLIAELIERHDRRRFEVAGYCFGPDDVSPVRRRLIDGFDRFVSVRDLSHAAAAARIEDDQIDILIDLKGYTQHARTPILSLRPAPIQVNYLGYPATMGAGFIDYIIADHVCIPPGAEVFYSEQVVRLPHSYQPNDTLRAIAAETPSRAACGLPDQGFVFCSFNASYKITPAMFDVWMRLLAQTPGAVLWLLECNGSVKANLRGEAARRGVDPDRLVFAPRRPLAEHLARHRLADLFLDTLPCNAHTTASEALWAGLPVLTCLGETFAGRVAASLLTALNLSELICVSLDEYEAAALRLAADPAALAAIRARLERNRADAPLFDIARYTQHLEAAYARMWEVHGQGRPPQAFDLADDLYALN